MNRLEQFRSLFPNEKPFRWRQAEKAFFDSKIKGWAELSVLPKPMRDALSYKVPWLFYKNPLILTSRQKDTHKAILTLDDGLAIETVLMANARDQWTICVSSQVGCAMRCGFCATGKMGLTRNLSADEIIDQYRFWSIFLSDHPALPARISNVVFMGMGEPMANYENVKKTLRTWLQNTDLGPTHITVSTVGLLPVLQKLITDPEWPPVRLAISLHSADPKTRRAIVPTSHADFLPQLQEWAKRYLKELGNRRHHLTFEYVMLRDVNDTLHHATTLAVFAKPLGQVKVNLIPYNFTDLGFQKSHDAQIDIFKKRLEDGGIEVTVRRTMGDDIAAACGQLITQNKSGKV